MNPLIDAWGNVHVPVAQGETPRIVSLVPSITELLIDLGMAPYLVGRTGFCIHPKELVASIPKIGGTKDVNIEKIRRLAPTHVIVNIDENEKPCVDQLAEFVPHIVVTHPITPQDNFALYRLLGAIFGVLPAAEALCQRLQSALDQLPTASASKKLLYCIWKDPWMTVSQDTYIANMLALCNCTIWRTPQALAATTPEQIAALPRYPVFEWEQIQTGELDAILLSTEPYRFQQEHVEALQKQSACPVILVDGEMLSWYGSRAVLGVEYLGKLAIASF